MGPSPHIYGKEVGEGFAYSCREDLNRPESRGDNRNFHHHFGTLAPASAGGLCHCQGFREFVAHLPSKLVAFAFQFSVQHKNERKMSKKPCKADLHL